MKSLDAIISILGLVIFLLPYQSRAQKNSGPLVTHEVEFTIAIDGVTEGKFKIGLFGEIVPITTQNFFQLATHQKGYGYTGSKFHKVIKNFMIEGGDFTRSDGSGGKSIYGNTFPDENFKLNHYGAGWVSMVNKEAKDNNGSLFRITTVHTPWLDGKNVVFGKIVSGMDIVRKIENTPTGLGDRPIKDCVITFSDGIKLENPYTTAKEPAMEQDL